MSMGAAIAGIASGIGSLGAAKIGSNAQQDRMAPDEVKGHMDVVYPGTSSWEQLGSGAGNAPLEASTQEANAKNQQANQMAMAKMDFGKTLIHEGLNYDLEQQKIDLTEEQVGYQGDQTGANVKQIDASISKMSTEERKNEASEALDLQKALQSKAVTTKEEAMAVLEQHRAANADKYVNKETSSTNLVHMAEKHILAGRNIDELGPMLHDYVQKLKPQVKSKAEEIGSGIKSAGKFLFNPKGKKSPKPDHLKGQPEWGL